MACEQTGLVISSVLPCLTSLSNQRDGVCAEQTGLYHLFSAAEPARLVLRCTLGLAPTAMLSCLVGPPPPRHHVHG